MIEAADIQNNLVGAWRVMTGRADGLRMLDISAEGFWNSFLAIVIAAPALAIGWISHANELMLYDQTASRFGIMMRLAAIDLSMWIMPLVGLALVARQAGIADRYVHYVVSGNWASALLIWMMLPPSIMRLLVPESADIANLVMLLLYLAALVFTWKQTNVALNKGPAVATALFVAIFLSGIVTLLLMQSLLGLDPPAQLPG